MHPFCCTPPIPVSPAAANHQHSSSSPSPTAPVQPMSPPPPPPARSRSFSATSSSNPASASVRASFREVLLPTHHEISGILYKWVNYGKGWRPRWFVLQDGVLSYYKIHGPDRIDVNPETEKGSVVIGEESLKRVNRAKSSDHGHGHNYGYNHGHGNGGSPVHARKPIGEVHLKVSQIRESRSDDRRFSIFSGTKTLRLRAETREDRATWLEYLLAVKEMFPRMSNSDKDGPNAGAAAAVAERLRQRLHEEGVPETVIIDCERLVREEFAALQSQLTLLKQRHARLVDTLRHLEKRLTWRIRSLMRARDNQKRSGSDSDEFNERNEEEAEEEDGAYFDTRDFLSSSSFKSSNSDFHRSDNDSDSDEPPPSDGIDPSMQVVGTSYPYVRRRRKLPDPVEKEKGVSLWNMIKDNIGKDLTKVCLPVYFNEPLSSLEKCFEDLEYSYLLDRAYEWGKRGNSLMRALCVAAFAVSGYASTEGRTCKPFNPVLGETYEADFPDKGIRFFSEKVSHHPMIVACHCEGNGWKFWADSTLKSKFWGRSIQLDPVGVLTLEFDDGEVFQWSKVTTSIYNLILGKLYCDHYGTMRIEGNREFSCKLKFKEQSIIDRNPHQVQGVVQDRHGKTVATVVGKWDESMQFVNGDYFGGKGKGTEQLSDAQVLWKRSKPAKYPTRYNFTRFAITLNELTPELKEKLPPTDSRLRPDQRSLENGEYDKANSEKLRLEQRQRQARKMQESGWKPRWFSKDKATDTYRYIGGYWEAREKGNWEGCPDIFGQVPITDQLLTDE
ncbi:oxysterol-binding protein-related protein 1B-like isoform X4 [Carex rostrata]